VIAVESEVALDLGCKYCARVYLAIWERGGTSWLEQIMEDTSMRVNTVRRHLDRLLALKLVAECTIPGYKIAKELDSVKKLKRGEVSKSE
jgi:hypothetical protein